MKRILRLGIVLVVVLALAGAGFLFWQRMQSQRAAAEVPPPTATVTRGSIEEAVTATGNVAADQQATLTFASSGEIAQVLVDKGQEVEAGEVLARLDTESLEWQIARAQASLDTAQARLEQAQQPATEEELASAQAALDSAIAGLDKVKEGASTEDLASAQAALDSANKAYRQVLAGATDEEIAAARASLDSAKAAVAQAQAAYDKIKYLPDAQMRQESLNLQNATIELERAQANYDAVVSRPTESEVASAKAQVAQAEAQLAALEDRTTDSDLASAESQIAQAESQLAQLRQRPKAEDVAVFQAQLDEAVVGLAQAQSQLEDAYIKAPFGGTVLSVQIREGEWATPGAPAIVLAATEPLVLDVNVDEVDVAQLSEGQTAYLTFDALGDEVVAGTVTYIAPSSTNVGGAVAYAVEISFSPGELPVRLGMTTDVDIVTASVEEGLLVPNQAVEADRQAGRYFVNVPGPDGATERLEVQIGLRDESQTQILEGLEEGDVVLLPIIPEQVEREDRFGPPGGGPRGGP